MQKFPVYIFKLLISERTPAKKKMICRAVWKNRNFKLSRLFSSVVQPEASRNEAIPYPPIEDVSKEAIRAKKKQEFRDKIRKCPTIEEKIIQLNMPRYYGYKCLMLENNDFPYNPLPFVQYVTKTDFQVLAEKITNEEEAKTVDTYLNLIKSDVQDAIEFEIDAYK